VRFFTIIGTTIVEGYGISECSPVVSCNLPYDRDVETVGPLLEGLEAVIEDDGELLISGPIVMKGYHNKPEETKEVINEDGAFRTGDLAVWTDNRKIKIIGRKKEIIVMANGKNIAPVKIENMLNAEPIIDTACVVGDEKKYLAALIVPDFDEIKLYAAEHEYHYKDDKDLVNHPGIQKLIKKKVDEVNKKVESYEVLKKYKIMDVKFSIESGELTPSLKLKRREVKKKYKHFIEGLYT